MKKINGVEYVNGFPTVEVHPETHELKLSEEEMKAITTLYNGVVVPDMGNYVIVKDDAPVYSFPPELVYLTDEHREAAGYLLGNWMAYTEDIYDELIGLGVEPIDLTYMINWKRDE